MMCTRDEDLSFDDEVVVVGMELTVGSMMDARLSMALRNDSLVVEDVVLEPSLSRWTSRAE